jgi:hypothetical protein
VGLVTKIIHSILKYNQRHVPQRGTGSWALPSQGSGYVHPETGTAMSAVSFGWFQPLPALGEERAHDLISNFGSCLSLPVGHLEMMAAS